MFLGENPSGTLRYYRCNTMKVKQIKSQTHTSDGTTVNAVNRGHPPRSVSVFPGAAAAAAAAPFAPSRLTEHTCPESQSVATCRHYLSPHAVPAHEVMQHHHYLLDMHGSPLQQQKKEQLCISALYLVFIGFAHTSGL